MSSSSMPSLLVHFRASATSPLSNLRERLRLELSEREAVKHIDHLIHLSASAVVATVVERLHKLAQAMRA